LTRRLDWPGSPIDRLVDPKHGSGPGMVEAALATVRTDRLSGRMRLEAGPARADAGSSGRRASANAVLALAQVLEVSVEDLHS
jgi:hypothetical protein